MFSSRGLFSQVVCPYSESCLLPRCIFKHPNGKPADVNTTVTNNGDNMASQLELGGRYGRLNDQDKPNPAVSSIQLEAATPAKSSPQSPSSDKSLKRGSADTRYISPPPLRRKTDADSHVTVKPPSSQVSFAPAALTSRIAVKAPAKTSVKASPQAATKSPIRAPVKVPVKEEGLNPRALRGTAPASHDMRFRLLRALHEQLVRLNTEVANDASDAEESLVLSAQDLIKKALDIEEDAAAVPSIYPNMVKNKILVYKRMSVKQWVDERTKEVVAIKAKEAGLPPPKPVEPPAPIESSLTTEQELALLPRIYTPVGHLTAHGYVNSIPTEKDIASAKAGIAAAKGWELCDRCRTRFQVFPGRREEDGALASNGKCTYHFGKPYFPDRDPKDPKARREKKYRCCGEGLGESSGCTKSEYHVFKISEVKRLAAVLNFEITPENPSKKGTRPVCIDGEMGYTVYGLELIRLTATSWPDGASLFDVLVKPVGLVLDLNSRYSGVWPKDFASALPYIPSSNELESSKLRIVSSPAHARSLLFSHLTPQTPLIGHGLENDLNATRLIHPTIIDTALLFPHKAGLPYRNGLKMLMSSILKRQIQVVVEGENQQGKGGHDSKEDANAAGLLVRWRVGEEWRRMRREGWTLESKEGVVFVAPGAKGQPANKLLKAGASPTKILVAGKGKQNTANEAEDDGDIEMSMEADE